MTIDYHEYCNRYTASTTASAGACTWKKIPSSGYNTTSHTLKPLIAGRHIVQIRAVNTSGHSNPSEQINAIYTPPTAAIARPTTDGPRSPLTSFTITFSHEIAAASTCTQPFTAREAAARQVAYDALANQYEVFYRIFLEQSCGHVSDQTFNDTPKHLATDACTYS